MTGQRKPSLKAILADLLVGVGSQVLMAHAFPDGDVWDDWVPWEETPIQEYLESLPEETEPVDSFLSTPLPVVSLDIPLADLLLPIVGLERVFGFRVTAISSMIGVPVPIVQDWLKGRIAPVGADLIKIALLSSLYVQLARHFDGKPHQEFHRWLATPLAGLGKRCPAQALLEGHALPVLNYLTLWSVRDERRRQPN
jgi:hypothetical protein